MRFTGSLTAFLIILTNASPASEDAQPFRILAPEEIAQHQQALQQLRGEQRERYRDGVYRELVQRAQAHGYRMPSTPPWQQQAQQPGFRPDAQAAATSGKPGPTAETSPPADAGTPKPDMPKLVAQQKRVIEEAVQQELTERSQASAATAKEAAKGANAATDSYREKMRRRFDDFMARRESRQHPAAGTGAAPPQPGAPDAPASAPMQPASPPGARPPAYRVPPTPPQMMPPRFPAPAYPQPAYPAPAYPPRPYFPQPAYPQGMPGSPPPGYPPRAPGWY